MRGGVRVNLNLMLELKLTQEEKPRLVSCMLAL